MISRQKFFLPRCLTKNSTANIELELSRPMCLELYQNCKDLGRFMLRYGGKTIAAGIVTEVMYEQLMHVDWRERPRSIFQSFNYTCIVW